MIKIERVLHKRDYDDLNHYTTCFRCIQDTPRIHKVYAILNHYFLSVSIYSCELEDALYGMLRYKLLGFITMTSIKKYQLAFGY